MLLLVVLAHPLLSWQRSAGLYFRYWWSPCCCCCVQAAINAFVLGAVFWDGEMLLALFDRQPGRTASWNRLCTEQFPSAEGLECVTHIWGHTWNFLLALQLPFKTMSWKKCKKAESRFQEDTANLCLQWVWCGMSPLFVFPFCLCWWYLNVFVFHFLSLCTIF